MRSAVSLGGSSHFSSWAIAIDVNYFNRSLSLVNIYLTVLNSWFKQNRGNSLFDSNVLCCRVCAKVRNSMYIIIFNINDLVVDCVSFAVTIKIGSSGSMSILRRYLLRLIQFKAGQSISWTSWSESSIFLSKHIFKKTSAVCILHVEI
jgi:hypothetical protein